MKKLVVFTGAGISAESGLKTFRATDGLWEEYRVSDVATPEAWLRNPAFVNDFYNKRRKQILKAEPNVAHLAIAGLEKHFDVHVVTQNIDDLHERAGSKKVLHLHGEIKKVRSTANPNLIYDLSGWQLKFGDKCELGSYLRPHIVWFGELVPNMEAAYKIITQAEIFLVVGSSLSVHPAAALVLYAPDRCKKFLIDPSDINVPEIKNLKIYKEKAGTGVPKVVRELLKGAAKKIS